MNFKELSDLTSTGINLMLDGFNESFREEYDGNNVVAMSAVGFMQDDRVNIKCFVKFVPFFCTDSVEFILGDIQTCDEISMQSAIDNQIKMVKKLYNAYKN